MTVLLRVARIGSTQAEAILRARSGAAPGTTVIASSQDRGIGRAQHRWASPPGGLYLSRIESDPGGPVELLPMAIALELADWLERAGSVRASIRWPNDLWLPDPPGKVAGILADRVASPRGPRLVLGVGVNVASDRREFPEAIRPEVAILRERSPRAITLAEAEAEVLRGIRGALGRLNAPDGPSHIVHDVGARLDGVGGPAAVDGVPAGRILGLDPSGGLVTESGGRRHVHRAGTVRLGP